MQGAGDQAIIGTSRTTLFIGDPARAEARHQTESDAARPTAITSYFSSAGKFE